MDYFLNNQWIGVAFVGLISFVLGLFVRKIPVFKASPRPLDEQPEPHSPSVNDQTAKDKAMLENILEDIQEGVLVTNSDNTIIWANKNALETLKTSKNLSLGKNIGQILPGSQANISSQSFQIKLKTLDGETITMSIKTFPLTNVPQSQDDKIYIIKNITEEIVLEEMKLDFVAIAAHQLRTPLTSIRGYLSVLASSAMAKLSPQEQQFLQRSIISSGRLSSLIENLLNVSQIEKGALKVSFKPVNIEQLVKQTVFEHQQNAIENQVQLIVDTHSSPYHQVSGDANLLGEALSNIISNGIKYNHPGGHVAVSLEKQKEGIVIHVSDNGKGMSENTQSHLFQRFYQGTNSLSELSNGLGLGLYISKSIIEAHKGQILVNSLEGKGTTVTISLPII